MATLLDRPKSEYLLPPHQAGLHQEATAWLSDLEFCKTELSFLNKLLNKSLLRIQNKKEINDLDKFEKKVKKFRSTDLKSIHDEVIRHEQRLSALDENMFSQDEQSIRDEHKKISIEVSVFMESVRKIKKEIFEFVEEEIHFVKVK